MTEESGCWEFVSQYTAVYYDKGAVGSAVLWHIEG